MAGNFRYFSAGPLPALAVLLVIGLVILMIPLLILGFIGAAFTRLGLSWTAALALVMLMLAGSLVNIPVTSIKREMIRAVAIDSDGNELASSFSRIPVWETRIAMNLGGGIIPVGIVVYMVYQASVAGLSSLIVPITICAVLVFAITFISTREIPGSGIRVPFLIPSLSALLLGLFLTGGPGLAAAVTALSGGTLGTLGGGNLAHLLHVQDLEVPDVSIGGSGTFGAVFLCCIMPALIA